MSFARASFMVILKFIEFCTIAKVEPYIHIWESVKMLFKVLMSISNVFIGKEGHIL